MVGTDAVPLRFNYIVRIRFDLDSTSLRQAFDQRSTAYRRPQ